MMRATIALVLLAHGVGHSLGMLQTFKVAVVNPQWNGDSWILTGLVGGSAASATGVILWTAAIAGFAVLAGVVMGWLPGAWFVPLALVSAVVSLAGVACFPLAFPIASTVGAVLVDVVLLWAVAVHWDPGQLTA